MMQSINRIFFLLILLYQTISVNYAQNRDALMLQAEKKYEQGKYKKALKKIQQAKSLDLGFCGTGLLYTTSRINLLLAKIYMAQKKYPLARNYLDSIREKPISFNLDSMRIRSYQLEYGKDSLSKMVDAALLKANYIKRQYDCILFLPLINGETIKLQVTCPYTGGLYVERDEKKLLLQVIAEFRTSTFYKMLKEI